MAWFAFALGFLLQAAPPAAQAPAPTPASAQVEGAGVAIAQRLAEDYRRDGRVAAQIITNADHGAQTANRRLSQRRARAVADVLVSGGIPRGVIVERPVGETEPLVMPADWVPDPFDRYARIIFPVPPPRWAIVP